MGQTMRPRLELSCYIVGAILISGNAFGYCSPPTMFEDPPQPPSNWQKPTAPYCMYGYSISREHDCDQWEVDAYISDINEYIRKLNDYTGHARRYAEAAIEFAIAAREYSICEAKDVKSDIE